MSWGNDLFVVILLGIRDHGLGSRLPVGGAHLTVSINELEGFNQPQVFIRVSANGKIVDWGVSDDSFCVDDICGSVWNANILSMLDEAAISFRDGFVDVWNKRDFHRPKSSFFSWFQGIFHVWEFRVNGDSNDFAAGVSELLGLIIEGNDFSGAYEGEVERIEEQNDVFTEVGTDVNVNKVILFPGGSYKVWGWLPYERHINFLIKRYGWWCHFNSLLMEFTRTMKNIKIGSFSFTFSPWWFIGWRAKSSINQRKMVA